MRAGFGEDDAEHRRLANDGSINADVCTLRIDEHDDVASSSFCFRDSFFRSRFLIRRRAGHVTQELLQVHAAFFDVIRFQLSLSEVQENGGMLLKRIRLQESTSRVFEPT